MSDISITGLSIVTTLLTMPILVVGLFFLRKSKYFVRFFGVNTMLILYILCAFRLFVPLEFPEHTVFIDDTVVFTKVYDVLENRSDLTSWLPIPLIDILLITVVIGHLYLPDGSVCTLQQKYI